MSVKRPSKADFLIAAEDHSYHLSDSQMECFLNLADETLGSYDAIDKLYAQTIAQQPPSVNSARRRTLTICTAPGT